MSLRRRPYVLAGATLATAALTTSLAIAATTQEYSQKFTVKTPGQSTGMAFKARAYDVVKGTPDRAKKVTLTFPSGTKINSGALAKCTNASACSPKSKVGSGKATAIVGTAHLPLAAIAYNRSGGMVLVIGNPLDPAKPFVLQPRFVGSNPIKLILDLPAIKAGQFTAVISELSVVVNKIGTGKKAYVKTPSSCPKGGAWKFTGKFEFVNEGSQTLTSKSPCVKG